MQDYAPDPYNEGNPGEPRYDGTDEGVGAGSAPPEQLVSEPSRTFGRPPRGVAPPVGYAPGNAETNPSYLIMSSPYDGDSGDVVFDPGTGTWIAASKHKHRGKKGAGLFPNPMMPGMPGMGFDMYGRPMMAPMMMPGAMPGAFPPMYPGMMPPPMPIPSSSKSHSSKSSKKDIKREARKEMKKMLKKEKEEEEKRLEKEARRRRKEMERQWQEDEEQEQEQRQAERRRMEEEARARAIDDARQKAAREAAERDAREREAYQREREEAARRVKEHEIRKRAAHEEKMKAKREAKEREERIAEARQQERDAHLRREQALAGIEEAARRGAHSPTLSRNSWLSERRAVPPYNQHDDDFEEELYDRKPPHNRAPRLSSPQSYRSDPPAYRSHPSSRTPSGDDYNTDHDATRSWLDDTRSDAQSIRSVSTSQRYLHPDGRYLPQGNPYQDHYRRPRANSSSQLEARSAFDSSDTGSVRSAQTGRSRAPSVATSVRSDGAYSSRRGGPNDSSRFLHPSRRPQASRSKSQPESQTIDTGDWDFGDDDKTPTASKPATSGPSLLSSAMQRLGFSNSSPNEQGKELTPAEAEEEDDDDEAIYVRSRSLTTSMQSSLLSASDRFGDNGSTRSGRSARSYMSDDSRPNGSHSSASSRRMHR